MRAQLLLPLLIGVLFACEVTNESTATSRIGSTQLTAYFHPGYGFVKVDYTNIDPSKTVLELVDFVRDNQDLSLT